MFERATFPIELRWRGAKEGVVGSAKDRLPETVVASPPEFGGPEGTWSPEHFFVAAVASCFMTTFKTVAELSSLKVLKFEIFAAGDVVRGEDRRYRFESVRLEPHITVDSERAAERAPKLVEKAEAACLVSRSLSTPVEVHPVVEVAEPAQVGAPV